MIMDVPNMTILLVDHEQMCLDTLGPHNDTAHGTSGGKMVGCRPAGSCSIIGRPTSEI